MQKIGKETARVSKNLLVGTFVSQGITVNQNAVAFENLIFACMLVIR